VGDARTLYGGDLQITDLRGPLGRQDPNVYALASGRLVVQGDARRGNPTTGIIPAGAIVERELVHTYILDIAVGEKKAPAKGFKLVLKKPDLTTASQLALQINAGALTGPGGRRMDVARTLDGGSLLVLIPTVEEYRAVTGSAPEVNYVDEPVRWLDVVLNRPVSFYTTEHATVIINDATKTVSWTGEVKLREGSVMLAVLGQRPSVFRARDGDRLADFMAANAIVLTEQQIVDVVKALHQAGLIKAEVKSQ
jgi:flagellar basal body P-ring protein FlgI